MAVRQLEFAFLQQIHDLFIAIQCAIRGNFPVKLVDPTTLQIILRNVTVHLSDSYEMIVVTRTESIHTYCQIATVYIIATAHCIKLIVSIPLKAAY